MDTEELMNSRMPLWIGLLTTSIVSLCAMIAELPDRNDEAALEWARAQKWAVSVASISIAFSTFGALGAALGRDKFNGSKAESMFVSDDIHNLNHCGLEFCIRQFISRYFCFRVFAMIYLTMFILSPLLLIYRSLSSLRSGLLDFPASTIPAIGLPSILIEAFEMPICISFLGEA